MVRNKLILILTMFFISGSLYSQNFFDRLIHPDIIGGNIIGCRQDQTSLNSPGEGVGPGAELFIQYNINRNLFVKAGTGYITATDKFFGWDNQKVTLFPAFKLDLGYNFINSGNLSTYLNAGLLGFKSKYEIKNPVSEEDMKFDAAVSGGLGLSYKLTDQLALNASGSGNYAFTSSLPTNEPDVTKPLFWFAKMGISYALNKSQKSHIDNKQEIEYPFSGDEIALDDIFNTEREGESYSRQQESVSEDEALDLLFQAAEEESGSEDTYENLFSESGDTKQTSDSYADGNKSQIVHQINELRNKINERDRIISELREKVNKNEKTISKFAGQEGSMKSDTYSEYVDSGNFTNAYKKTLQFYYNKNYSQAINRFQNLLNSNPNHKLASNCQYWIGECYYAMRNYQQALNAFKNVLTYNSSYKFDDALIMNGITYMKIGEAEMAKKNFQQLVENYPNSEYAPKAMRYLGRL
ncbi:MAG: tetratricopeptide repeat protein [bacterium]